MATYPGVHEGHSRKHRDRNIADVEHHGSLAAWLTLQARDCRVRVSQAYFWQNSPVGAWHVRSAGLPGLEAMIFHSGPHTAARAPRVIGKMSGTRKDIVVVDLGGSTIKAGFAGDAEPTRCAFPAPSLPRSSRSISMP